MTQHLIALSLMRRSGLFRPKNYTESHPPELNKRSSRRPINTPVVLRTILQTEENKMNNRGLSYKVRLQSLRAAGCAAAWELARCTTRLKCQPSYKNATEREREKKKGETSKVNVSLTFVGTAKVGVDRPVFHGFGGTKPPISFP